MPGPPPNPNARRRNNREDWRTLPAVCARRAPAWPMAGRKPAGLVELWRHLWALPVAELWHERGSVMLVARYARARLAYERGTEGSDSAAYQNMLTRTEQALLLTPEAQLAKRLLVADRDVVPVSRTEGNVTHVEFGDLDVG